MYFGNHCSLKDGNIPCVCFVSKPGRKGGELASAVHSYGKTGDPQMRALVQHILSLVSHPILNFLYRWIYDGELEDTYHEVPTHAHVPFVGPKYSTVSPNLNERERVGAHFRTTAPSDRSGV